MKNADTSIAMGDDKVADILGTGAEVLTAADTSCLMHIGGLLSRRGSAVRVMHLAEILAGHRAERDGATAMTLRRPGPPTRARAQPLPTFRGTPPFPEAARDALADPQLRANLRRATTTIRDKRATGGRRARRTGRSCGWPAPRSRTTSCATCRRLLERLERAVVAAGGVVHWARDAAEANAIVVEVARAHGATRGGQGQVDGHPGDRAQRGARPRRASTSGRPTWPS